MAGWDELPPSSQEMGAQGQGGGWDSEPPPKDDYWGDVRKNAWEGAKEIPGGAMSLANAATKVATAATPMGMARSAYDMARGKPFLETPTGEGVNTMYTVAKEVPGALFSTAKTIGKAGYAPVERMSGIPMRETMFGKQFRERPLSTTADMTAIIPVAKGAMAAGRATFAGKGANILERMGARGINNSVGVTPGTIEDMTRYGQNPGRVGIDLGTKLADEGMGGMGPTPAFDVAVKNSKQYGRDVENALNQIKKANRSLGEYPELADPLKVESNPILKPILDEANRLRDSGYPADRFTSRYQRAMYNSLSNKAEKGGGFLRLDDINDEMRKLGNMLQTTSEENAKIVKKLYGRMADVRDKMVDEIAEASGDANLGTALKQANAGYSRYMRILPDIKSASAKEGTGKSSLFSGHPIDAAVKTVQPVLSNVTFKAGKGARRLFEESPVSAKKILKDKRGSIFPEDDVNAMPVFERTNQGPAHALFTYEDNFGPGGAKRRMYNLFGDPGDPKLAYEGGGNGFWGSTVSEDFLKQRGIPIKGREKPKDMGQFNEERKRLFGQ